MENIETKIYYYNGLEIMGRTWLEIIGKKRERLEYCIHPTGAKCVNATTRYHYACETCTKWNKKIQKSNFKEREIK